MRPPLGLIVFPLVQGGLLALACAHHPAWVLAAALVHTFTVHVCVHEFLHYSDRRRLAPAAGWVFSVATGVPFDGYRLHHHNHHRYENGAGDFSSTVSRPLWRYALGWPVQLVKTGRALRASGISVGAQKFAIAAAFALLAAGAWWWPLLYLLMVYLGWALVSVHNYGQHPPAEGSPIPSFSARWYNLLFFNNGLHHEHHAEPGKPWGELEPDPAARQIATAHLLAPLAGGARGNP